MTRPADAYVPAPWLPDVDTLDNYAAAIADGICRDLVTGTSGDYVRDRARAYVAVCHAIDRAWFAYARATRAEYAA